MDAVTADEFTEHFDRYRQMAERSPLTVTDAGRTDLVVLGADEFRRLEMLERPAPTVANDLPSGLSEAFDRALDDTKDVTPTPLPITGHSTA